MKTSNYKIFQIQVFIDVKVLFYTTLFCFFLMKSLEMFFQVCLNEESLFTQITFIRLEIEMDFCSIIMRYLHIAT